MPKKKPFIDKNHAQTFHVVHRSQRDPEIANPDASAHVLVPVEKQKDDHGAAGSQASTSAAPRIRLDDWEYGDLGLPNDGYDYSQHLRPSGTVGAVFVPAAADGNQNKAGSTASGGVRFSHLPDDVFPSKSQNPVGMLNLAASSGLDLSIDPDIAAALDDDAPHQSRHISGKDPDEEDPYGLFGSDVEEEVIYGPEAVGEEEEKDAASARHTIRAQGDIEDDFVALADEEGEEGGRAAFRAHHGFATEGSVEESSEGPPGQHIPGNMSIASTLFARGGKPSLNDDRLEVLVDSYEDVEIGELSEEDADVQGGGVDVNTLDDMLDEFLESQKGIGEVPMETGPVKAALKARPEGMEEEEEHTRVTLLEDLTRDGQRERWDCETILTSLSTTDNLPGVIHAPHKGKPRAVRKKMPVVEEEEEEEEEVINRGAARPKKETPEERRARKHAVKADRKARRNEKTTKQQRFKQEEIRQVEVGQRTAMDVATGASVIKY